MAVTFNRCSWANDSLIETKYHDTEWGVPVYDDNKLFEMLILESQHTGLSWYLILKKRELLKEAYLNFDPLLLSKLSDEELNLYLNDNRVIKHKLKIYSVRSNAKSFLNIQSKYGSFSKYLWKFVNNEPISNDIKNVNDLPKYTNLAEDISKDLKINGFKFIGAITIQSYIEGIGLINNHVNDCFRKSVK